MKTLKTELYQTVHNARLSVDQIAEFLNVSASYLYRSVLEGESGCRFPLDLLLPLMHATKDFRVLELLNQRCDRVTAKLPRVRKAKADGSVVISEVQRDFATLMVEILTYFNEPDEAKVSEIEERIHAHVGEMLTLRKAVQTYKQRELDL